MSAWSPFRRRPAPEEPDAHDPRELPPEARVEVVRAYHRATCHHPHRYAAGPGYLDWANQPDPFRRYAGAALLALEHTPPEAGAAYEDVWLEGALAPQPLTRASLSRLFEYALGLAAWKEIPGARWSLRVDPSSGNLHPTEAHLVAPPIEGLCDAPFLAHYAPREHALELRARLAPESWGRLAADLPAGAFLVALSSIHWREAWKYGERAYRYCQHDAGHALACVSLSAAALGWSARLVDGYGSEELRALLGLADARGAEPEEPELLLAIAPRLDAEPELPALSAAELEGCPNRLSEEHVDWDAIELVAAACLAPRRPPRPALALPPPIDAAALAPVARAGEAFAGVARRRRSAVAMDGATAMPRAAFYRALARTVPGAGARPFDALPWAPRVALALFVHLVDGLEPGLYVLARSEPQEALLRSELRPDFLWERAPDAPAGLRLFRLARGLVKSRAATVSCHQDIAGLSAFSLGMLAELDGALAADGPSAYPRLYWECGAIGQVLYLEAEALGLRATGIGCFFDELVHETFGLRTEALRSLYHFTVGGAVEDERLTSLPPYPAP